MERWALALLGTLFLVFGFGPAFVLLRIGVVGSGNERIHAAASALIFLALGAYGASLVGRGLRGWSRRIARHPLSPQAARELEDISGIRVLIVLLVTAFFIRGQTPGSGLEWAGWSLIAASVGLAISTVAHEVGHLVPGLLQGRRLAAVWVWPIRFQVSQSGVRVSFDWRTSNLALGSVAWQPGSEVRGPWADRLMLVGGPLGDAILVGLLLVGAWKWPVRPPASAVPTFLFVGALFNAYLVAVNLVPRGRNARRENDGSRIARTFGRGQGAAAFRDMVLGLAVRCRPREWTVTPFALEEYATAEGTTDLDRSWLLLLAAAVNLDTGNYPDAERLLELARSVPGASADVRRDIGLQRALIAALLNKDPLAARTEVDRVTGLMPPDGYEELALAAILLSEGKRDESARSLASWRRNRTSQPIWEAGNQWALDRLGSELASPGQPSGVGD